MLFGRCAAAWYRPPHGRREETPEPCRHRWVLLVQDEADPCHCLQEDGSGIQKAVARRLLGEQDSGGVFPVITISQAQDGRKSVGRAEANRMEEEVSECCDCD